MRAAFAIGLTLFVCACSGPLGGGNVEDGIKEYYKESYEATKGTPREFPALKSVECTRANLSLDGTRWNEANDCVLVFADGTRIEDCMFSTKSRTVDSRYRGRCHVVPGRG